MLRASVKLVIDARAIAAAATLAPSALAFMQALKTKTPEPKQGSSQAIEPIPQKDPKQRDKRRNEAVLEYLLRP